LAYTGAPALATCAATSSTDTVPGTDSSVSFSRYASTSASFASLATALGAGSSAANDAYTTTAASAVASGVFAYG